MGINFDGVNPESKAKLDKIVADGKVTAEEVKGLTAAEKEALSKALGGKDLPVNGEIKLKDAPDMPKTKERSLGETLGVGAAIVAGTTLLGGLIGGAIGFFGGGVGAVPGAAAGAKLGALVGAALVGFSSCTGTDIDQDVNINIEQQNYQELLAALKDKEKADDARHKEIIALLTSLGKSMTEVVKTLVGMGAKLDQIIDLMVIAGSTTDEIVKLLKEQGKDIKDIYAALGNIQMEQSQQTELLKKLVDNDNIKIEYLQQILEEVKKGNNLQTNENDILNLIFAKLENLEKNDVEGAKLLNQILAQLTAFVKQEGDMDATTHALLQTIINNQESMSDDIKAGIAEILAKLDKMDDNAKERFEALIPLLGNLGELGVQILNAIKEGNALTSAQLQTIINQLGNQSDKLDDIKELIMKNNEIAQQTQDAVKDMSSKMSEEHKAILEAIKNGTASVDQIQEILVAIKNDTSVLPDMNKKLCVIGTAIDKILEEVKGMRAETKKGLLEILAKIPDGCHCQPTDLTAIIEILNKLLDAIQKDPKDDDKNHEGILTDLNKYFD